MRKLAFAVSGLLLAISCWAQAPVPDSPEIERRVDSILGQMTMEEKIRILGGVDSFDVPGFLRLNLPALHISDGPVAVRNDGPATVMAGGIGLAATWDPALAKQVAVQLGRDARAKDKHFLLGPGVNIYRSPLNGRNFEYFGEDPFLTSRITVSYIEGLQSQGVSATVKHFLANNSEFGRHVTDSVIDERTLREIYMPSFEAAVKEAHVGAIMDSYNFTNGHHMTENGYFNNDVAKKEWGFTGIMMSDWDATYDAVAAANGGLDMEMPSAKFLNAKLLLPAIHEGRVSVATIDDKVRRILRTELEFGWMDRPQRDESIPRYDLGASPVALQAAREGMVLLKNDGKLLPLDKTKTKTIAVIGPDAYPAVPVAGGSAQGSPFRAVSFLEGISTYLGAAGTVFYDRGLPTFAKVANTTDFYTTATGDERGVTVETFDNPELAGTPTSTRTQRHIGSGTALNIAGISSGEMEMDPSRSDHRKPVNTRWTAYYRAPAAGTYDIVVQLGGFDENGYRLYLDGKLLADHWKYFDATVSYSSVSMDAAAHKIVVEHHATTGFGGPFLRVGVVRQGAWTTQVAKDLAAKADVVIVAAGFDPSDETEGSDRTFRLPPGQDELIRDLAAVNKNIVLVATSGGGFDTNPWLAKVPAFIESWYAGQEGGRALPEILFGDVNPSGHLPITFERRWEDNPTHDNYYTDPGTNRVVYKEGIFVGYRGYEHDGVKPLFPFGYGLSYTTFDFAQIDVKPVSDAADGPAYEVSFDVKNTGTRAGATVAQVYVTQTAPHVPRPPKELKGFARVTLEPGETRRITVPLSPRSFAYYNVAAKKWQIDHDTFEISVGDSSEQIELRSKLSIAHAAQLK